MWSIWKRRAERRSLPIVRTDPQRPVPVNPPRRKSYSDDASWEAATRDHFRRLKEWERQKALRLGITQFRWVWAGGRPCSVAERMNGRVFSYERPPNEGLPGDCVCDLGQCIYCYANSIILGSD